MNTSKEVVPFPLYHGTSSHFLKNFKPGNTPGVWPHKASALDLLRSSWAGLTSRRSEVPKYLSDELGWDVEFEEVPWLVRVVLDQETGSSNWQHGELYLTPSVQAAVNYACGGAKYGGELLTFCRTAIDALAEIDRSIAEQLLRNSESLTGCLEGTERPPLVVELEGILVDHLSTETQRQDVEQQLASLSDGALRKMLGSDDDVRETIGQQMNFRLATGCGQVARVFQVHATDLTVPVSHYSLHEIRSCDVWDRALGGC